MFTHVSEKCAASILRAECKLINCLSDHRTYSFFCFCVIKLEIMISAFHGFEALLYMYTKVSEENTASDLK
jgi:hypothetical protein